MMESTLAQIPPMGWNSWDSFGTAVTENEVLANARFMKEHLLDAGWDIVVVDIDWYDPTAKSGGYNANAPLVLDAYGRQMPDTVRFPSANDGRGFTTLAETVHNMGLKFGVHMMRGIPRLAVERNLPVFGTPYHAQDIVDTEHVCGWNPDNYGLDQSHEGAQAWYDAQVDQLVAWGVDFLKVDDMQVPFHAEEIAAYGNAIDKARRKYGRDVTLSLSPGGSLPLTHLEFLREHAHMWRISDDLWDRWGDVYAQFSRLAIWAPHQTAGHWADADMLPLGHIGLRAEQGEDRQCELTDAEQRTLLALWCMGRSPLMVGGDLPTSSPETIALLQNPVLREVTAHTTDNREIIRERVRDVWGDESTYRGDLIVWTARSTMDASVLYVAVFWTGEQNRELAVELRSLIGVADATADFDLSDLWNEREGVIAIEGQGRDRVVRATVDAHGVAWFALRRKENTIGL